MLIENAASALVEGTVFRRVRITLYDEPVAWREGDSSNVNDLGSLRPHMGQNPRTAEAANPLFEECAVEGTILAITHAGSRK